MRLLFDARILQQPHPSGVGLYTHNLLQALIQAAPTDWQIRAYFNAFRPVQRPNIPDLEPLQTHWPNKLLTLIWRHVSFSPPGLNWPADFLHSPHLTLFHPQPIPRVVTLHDLTFSKFPQYLSPTDRFWHRHMTTTAKQAVRFVADSHATKNDLIRNWQLDGRRIRVIHPAAAIPPEQKVNAARTREILQRYHLAPEEYLLYLGNLEPRKNLQRLVCAFDQLLQNPNYRSLKLVLVGQPDYRSHELLKTIGKLPASANIVRTDYVTADQKHALLKQALGFVYVSLYEGFGMPVLEAMQCGIPVLTSDQSSLPEITGPHALTVNPYDVGAITLGMERLIEDRAWRHSVVKPAQQQAARFSWNKSAQALIELYQELA